MLMLGEENLEKGKPVSYTCATNKTTVIYLIKNKSCWNSTSHLIILQMAWQMIFFYQNSFRLRRWHWYSDFIILLLIFVLDTENTLRIFVLDTYKEANVMVLKSHILVNIWIYICTPTWDHNPVLWKGKVFAPIFTEKYISYLTMNSMVSHCFCLCYMMPHCCHLWYYKLIIYWDGGGLWLIYHCT